jgi:hypothetical protein
MIKSDSTAGRKSRKSPPCQSAHKIQHLLSAEEWVLQSISAGEPLPRVLHGICSALDCQIGSVVSFISLPADDPGELAEIVTKAASFGLHTFCSEAVVTEKDELLGTLEMYCSFPRSPSASESPWIERAICLAAIAIKLDQEAVHQVHCGLRANRPVQRRVLEWPVFLNAFSTARVPATAKNQRE